MRIEQDSLGKMEIPENAIYGIHSYRSRKNFIISQEFINPVLIKTYFQVKKAAAEANFKTGLLNEVKYNAIIKAIDDLIIETENACNNKSYEIYDKIIVDPYQGGAGTSLNMNVNEVIANTALKKLGKNYGEYEFIHPIDDVNLSQSTNDTYPTALKATSIYLLRELAESFDYLQKALNEKEKEFSNILKLGRTQFQDAVPITLGDEFGAYAKAITRDIKRLNDGEKKLREVNLGGTAIGTSVSAEEDYVENVNIILKTITKLPLTKAEDLVDATQNMDVFVEVHGLVKTGAVSIIKMCNDLRFLSSGPEGGIGEIFLPKMQAGSSIMPGKVNPVILEHSVQIAELVKGNDVIISNLAGSGNLELNPFAPLIAHLFLKSLVLLKEVLRILTDTCIKGIAANKKRCEENLMKSTAVAAFFIQEYGYDEVAVWVNDSLKDGIPFSEYLVKKNILGKEEIRKLIYKGKGISL